MIRRAIAADSADWYKIRNDAEALFWSDNKRAITPEEHARWWARVIHSYDHYLAVLDMPGSDVVGYGRFQDTRTAEISFGVSPRERGNGFGQEILSHLEIEARDRGVEQLVAYVHPANAASMRCFLKRGYVLGVNGSFQQLKKVIG